MRLIDKIKYKIPGTGSYYNQKALIWRNRGDSTALEIVDAVRIKYPDKPNIHELSTGEKIPAVPKDYVGNVYGGGSYFMAVEASDDQLVVFKPKFDLEELKEYADSDKDWKKLLGKQPVQIETDEEAENFKQRLIDKDYSAVNFAILDNRDERFTFLSEELKSASEKYGVGDWIKQHMDLILPVIAAVSIAIVMYVMRGDIVPALQELSQQMQTFNQNAGNLLEKLNSTRAPPGR